MLSWFAVFILMMPFQRAAIAQSKGIEKKPKGTICTITINSSEEREEFRKNLEPQGFQIRELIEDSPRSENKEELDSKDWFVTACKKLSEEGTHCDALVISGHFGGTFFGKSGKSLSLEQLEKASCSNSCNAVLKDPKAVYLFGCNTLAGKEEDNRTPKEYLQDLLNHGFNRNQAEMVVEARYGATGNTNQDRMRRVFGYAPKIYGFSSVGPSGANVKGKLSKYFKEFPEYQRFLREQEGVRATALANQTLNNLKKVGSPSDDPFIPCLKNSAITCSSGSCLAGKQESDAHEKLCKIRDKRRPLEERLGLLRDLLKQSDHLAYVPTAAEVLKDLDIKSLSPSERAIWDEIKSNQKLKSSLLDLVNTKSSTLITQRLNWIEFSSKLGWLSEAESVKEYQRIGRHLIQNFKDINDRDLIFSLLYDNPTIRSAINGDRDAIAPLTKALRDSDEDVRMASAYALRAIKPDDPAVNSALAKALGDADEDVRRASARALEAIKPDDPAVNSALVKALGDADVGVRYLSARAFGAIKPNDPAVNSALVKALGDSDFYVRWATAGALKAIKPNDPKIKEQLKAAGIQVDW